MVAKAAQNSGVAKINIGNLENYEKELFRRI